MQKKSDVEIKKLFEKVKGLMFWNHPVQYDLLKQFFNLTERTTYLNYVDFSNNELVTLILTLKEFIDMFPLSIYIETTNNCNLNCIMCPQKKSNRKKGKMSNNLFYKIIDEIAAKQPAVAVSPFFFGEPLMDNTIFDKLSYCKKMGLSYIKLSTNGSLLFKNDNYKKLIDTNLDSLIISFDAITRDKYESIRRGSDFSFFIRGVDSLINYKEKISSNIKIVGQFINLSNNQTEKKIFRNYIKTRKLEPQFVSLHHWGKPLNYEATKLRYPCNNPLYSAVILHNGDLTTCCMDYEGTCTFGNLNHNSLESLWKTKHKLLRDAQLKGEYSLYPVCSNCYDWVNFGYNKYAEILTKNASA